ncbi:protein phosphatase 1 regulatory subunit 16A isoform X2 [Trichogramma pretiosum]|uniref:protein phosphatase 1 regulatory subunit 16A isoform X2 n=1 Tax=Trichogramma pretiosum TaxID=7493 RepID=UPI0006C94836|nr:protein phosphatase 1 regulatory subunit 16A isoform X2 [Trichogramma pretiosum]
MPGKRDPFISRYNCRAQDRLAAMEHADLVKEMAEVETLTTQERLHLARHRRAQQLKVWKQREKEWQRHQLKHIIPSSKKHIFFSDSVMLLEAAARNDLEEVRRLLRKGVNPDSTNEDGLTALHQCCIDDNDEMMKILVEFGANVNAEDSEKWTPLHAAATCGHLHLVRYLINKGANLLAVNADGNMPYDICEDEKTLDCIEGEMARRGVTQELIDETRASTEVQMLRDLMRLQQSGGDLEYRDAQGATPLHIAAANGYLRVVEFLLEYHVSTDVQDNDKWQPVHAAACWGHLDVLELLVQNGADLNARNKHEETPADICEDPEIRERIVELKTEQETKKMRDANRRVRRSHSINTRTQSVRRTSIRDKTSITKKDAQEEARTLMRRQVEPTKIPAQSLSSPTSDNVMNQAEYEHESLPSSMATSDVRRAPEGKDNDSFVHEDMDKDSESHQANHMELQSLQQQLQHQQQQQHLQLQQNNQQTYDESRGKINIHVSVVFVKSLADLKKQRAQNRTSTLQPLQSSQQSLDTNSNSLTDQQLASDDFRRFTGNTSEIVCDTRSDKRCCSLM